MNYEITLDFYYQTFDSFKQKSCLILQKLFAGGRMIDYAKFHGYGIITTNGHKADKIVIEEIDKFTRSKTNCIIYDLTYKYIDIAYHPYSQEYIYLPFYAFRYYIKYIHKMRYPLTYLIYK